MPNDCSKIRALRGILPAQLPVCCTTLHCSDRRTDIIFTTEIERNTHHRHNLRPVLRLISVVFTSGALSWSDCRDFRKSTWSLISALPRSAQTPDPILHAKTTLDTGLSNWRVYCNAV